MHLRTSSQSPVRVFWKLVPNNLLSLGLGGMVDQLPKGLYGPFGTMSARASPSNRLPILMITLLRSGAISDQPKRQ